VEQIVVLQRLTRTRSTTASQKQDFYEALAAVWLAKDQQGPVGRIKLKGLWKFKSLQALGTVVTAGRRKTRENPL
jgi:hypothetical protein